MPPKCAIRNTPNAEICSLCHSRAYCSVEWQQTDWPLHKLLCKAKNDLPAGPKPCYKLGILFPDLSTRKHHNFSGSNVNAVKLTWLHTEAKKFDESPNPSKLLGESAFKKCLAIWKNVLRDYDLGQYGHCLVQGYVFGGWVEHKRNCRRKHARQARLRVGKIPYNINLLGRR